MPSSGRRVVQLLATPFRLVWRVLAPLVGAVAAFFAWCYRSAVLPVARVVWLVGAVAWKVGQNATVRLFIASMLSGCVIAVITGPAGSATAPTSGITASLRYPRVNWFLAFGLVLFVVRWFWSGFGAVVSAWTRARWLVTRTWMRKIVVRAPLEALLVAYGFAYVTRQDPQNSWRGGLLIQVGVSLLVLELVIALWNRVSHRLGRIVGYGAIAGYGALAWSNGSLGRYLNRINAVPHNHVLGKVLMVGAILLTVLDLAGFAVGLVRARTPARTSRAWLAGVGGALLVYGWLMWTHWIEWRDTEPSTFAHWLAVHHVLVHDHDVGLSLMWLGAASILAAGTWLLTDLVRATAGASKGMDFVRRGTGLGLARTAPTSFGKPALIVTVLFLALEWPLHMDPASQSNIVLQIMPYILLALGLNVVVGFAGLLDLGYVAFYAFGAYTAAYVTGALPVQPPFILDTFWAIPLAIIVPMLAGVLLGLPTLRLRGDYLAIVTLGFGEIIFIFANNLTNITGGASGAPGFVSPFSFHLITPILKASQEWSQGGAPYLPTYYLILGIVIVSMFAFSSLEHSRVGRTWAAIREDETAADSLGINPLKYKIMAFAIGASTGGMAGVVLVGQSGSIFSSDFTLQFSITVLVIVVFGGMGSIPGVILGAIIVQGLPNYLQQHNFSFYSQTDFNLYLGTLLIVMMIFRPQGIIPSRRRRREFGLTESGDRNELYVGADRADFMLESAGPISAETT